MIVVKNLRKEYGSRIAVADISFEVGEGKVLVLLGTSGCGKTTTLKMINRLIEPSGGSIEIDGKNILTQQPETLRKKIGYVLQNTGLFPHYSVAENVAVVPKLLGWKKDKTEQRTDELLGKLNLSPEEYKHIYPSQLSGGQQQRVGLARALAASPPVLLMDEPFAALDNITRTAIKKEFKELDEFKNKTIVLVTHDVQEAFELGDVICLLDKGKVMQCSSAEEMLFKPANDFVKNFFKEQQLLLEFKTIKLHQLWGFIENENAGDSAVADAKQSVWEVMNYLDKANGIESVTVSNEAKGEKKKINYKNLMKAFANYKSKLN